MKSKEKMIEKSIYKSPAIELIILDNEISLALQSIPPEGPGETSNVIASPEYFNNEPFRNA
jgi:hypothetical protein